MVVRPSNARLLALRHNNVSVTSSSCLRRSFNTASPARRPQFGTATVSQSVFKPLDKFLPRHVGPRDNDQDTMLQKVGNKTIDDFSSTVVPPSIRIPDSEVPDSFPALSESELLRYADELASKNKIYKSYIGLGYYNTVVPSVIQRNIIENPAWYTQYSPYQAEISQGRLESLVNFQTLCTDLTKLDVSNASLLDEATAAAEAMHIAFAQGKKKSTFLVDEATLPQTLSVLRTRADPMNIKIHVCNVAQVLKENDPSITSDVFGALVQYPDVNGTVSDWSEVAKQVHDLGGLFCVSADLLSLTMLKPPGEFGADVCIGSAQRLGVPLGYGGPHAAFFSCTDALKRRMPGRLIGLSKDANGQPAYRLALQTREQHIRREKATSNICTAQALLANMAAMYAVWHGPQGLQQIALKIHNLTAVVKAAVESFGHSTLNQSGFFDTITIRLANGLKAENVHAEARANKINLRPVESKDDSLIGLSLDETATVEDVVQLVNVFATVSGESLVTRESLVELSKSSGINLSENDTFTYSAIPQNLTRTSTYLQQPVFNTHRSETSMLRYLHQLQNKDLSLVHSMIPLGSCTMKLNPTSAMMPFTKPEWGSIHPFVPLEQSEGYRTMHKELEEYLCVATGFAAATLQPNSGAQGEYAGLSVIRAYHRARGDTNRNVCLIPLSAHGTNPASAHMAGMRVVPIKVRQNGNLDLDDLKAKAEKHKDELSAFMVTYPSTYGVFEDTISKACEIIHENGGQVYLDGANLNAQIGLTHPAKVGADVCHLNLHKTFAIPHGGGGPGQGPICVAQHLAKFLPAHPLVPIGGKDSIEPVSAAPWGSASINIISWAYITMLGGPGIKKSSQMALLNANYMVQRLKDHYNVKFTNENGRCAHEFLIDFAEFDKSAGVKVMDVAKRLIDYSFHPPTVAWPISTGMLIEPTESENLEEIDRFCDAMIKIRGEIDEIVSGKQPKDNNVFRNAPHSIETVTTEEWDKPYSRAKAVYPVPNLKKNKFWPAVSRVDDAYGDKNLFCTCDVSALAENNA